MISYGHYTPHYDFQDSVAYKYKLDEIRNEQKLHESFNGFRVNRVNNRKEFFKVELDHIEQKCNELGVNVEFTKLAQAKEYRETVTLINNENSNSKDIKNHILDEVNEALKKTA